MKLTVQMSSEPATARYKNFSVGPLQRWVFDTITGNRLIYNCCWEDPRIDRQLLEIDRDSRLLMITSAGGNALDYLLDDPASICCVDTNPVQNALMELKLATYSTGCHHLLWRLFGEGGFEGAFRSYREGIRPHLSERSQGYWDDHINYFTPTSIQPSFYFRGTAGWFAHHYYRRFRRRGIHGDILSLLNATSIEEQTRCYNRIEPYLWTPFHRWLLRRDLATALLGIPKAQRELIRDEERDLVAFIRSAMRHTFTHLPIGDNYFWRVYLTGSYTRGCCPNYLKTTHFGTIRSRMDRIESHTRSIAGHLRESTDTYSHFVLLDHMDWLSSGADEALDEEWRLILDHAEPGARILFRSASRRPRFLPDWITGRVAFQPTERLHRLDRVGTYGSTHLGIVR